jgi:uncharacterized membrane protein HdeD (DUF308 family)
MSRGQRIGIALLGAVGVLVGIFMLAFLPWDGAPVRLPLPGWFIGVAAIALGAGLILYAAFALRRR